MGARARQHPLVRPRRLGRSSRKAAREARLSDLRPRRFRPLRLSGHGHARTGRREFRRAPPRPHPRLHVPERRRGRRQRALSPLRYERRLDGRRLQDREGDADILRAFLGKRDACETLDLRDNPPFACGSAAGFLSLRDGRASPVKKSRKFTLSERAESIRQIGCAYSKARL